MNYADLNLGYDKINIVNIDNNNVLVASLNDEYMQQIRKYFTNTVSHARFTPQYKSGNWDGKIRFIKNDGLMPRGLLHDCVEKLKEWEIKVELDEELQQKEVDISNFDDIVKTELIDKQGGKNMVPWEHQWDAARALLKNKRGIVKAATSAGKSYIITMVSKYLLYTKLCKKVLLVVPRSDLVIQFQRDAEEYGFDPKDIGMFFGKVKDTEQPWIVATWQSLQNVKERDFFEQFDCLIVDEVHGSGSGDKSSKSKRANGGTKMRQICDHCVNATWRFGCTGTLPTEALDLRTVISGIGPKVYEVTANSLMKKGHVTDLKITVPFINYDKKVVNKYINKYLQEKEEEIRGEMSEGEEVVEIQHHATTKFNAEKSFIENYIPRLKMVSKIVKYRLQKDENILILANSLNFGEKLYKTINHLCKGEFTELCYIHGQMDENERKEIRERMENNKKMVIIATTSLFSTGISVKNLHTVIFGNMGKSKITVLQSIGRALRQHSTKKYARIYDLCDNLKYNSKHAQERLEHYASEQFDINIQEMNL